MKKSSLLLAVAAVASAALAAAAFQHWAVPKAPPSLLRPADLRLVGQGERLYQQHCAACHGANREGQPDWREPGPNGLLPAPPHDESGHTWHHPDAMLFRMTKLGIARAANLPDHKSAMPAFEGVLSDQEIVAVLSYIASKWPPSVRERHAKINAQYAAEQQRQN